MNRFNIALWVSCLALMALIASCGSSNIGSPIQDDLNAAPVDQHIGDAPLNPGMLADEVDTDGIIKEPTIEEGSRESSYLPGGYAWCYGPYQMVNHHYNYTFFWGSVVEAPDGLGDKLAIRSPKTSTSGVRYWFKKGAGEPTTTRIRRLQFEGFGTTLQVHLFNNATGAYDAWQTLNMDAGAAMGTWPSIAVGTQHINTSGRVVAEVRSPMGRYNEIYVINSQVF